MGSKGVVCLVLVMWTIACYVPSLKGPFFFDDELFIQKNLYVHSLTEIPKIYRSSVTEGAGLKDNFYRPNQQLLFAVIYSFVGETVTWPYHAMSLLLHSANGILVFFLLSLLGLSSVAAGIGAAIFLLHPGQTQAIAYVSGLSDPLCLFFMLMALFLWIRALQAFPKKPHLLYWILLPCFMVLALLSKENGVVLAPLALLCAIYVTQINKRKLYRSEVGTLFTLIVLAGIYSVLRLTILDFGQGMGLSPMQNQYTESLSLRLTTFVSVLWDYTVLIFYPLKLTYEKPYLAYESLASLRGLFGIGVLMASAAICILGIRRIPKVALGVSLLLAGLLPYTGIIPLNAMWLEHWFYVPMIGLGLLIGASFDTIPHTFARRIVLVVMGIVFCLFSYRTILRAGEWADVERFYLNEIQHGVASVRIINNLGMYYSDHGDLDKSIQFYKLAAAAELKMPQPHHNLARALLAKGMYNEALLELKEALRIEPTFIYSLRLLRQFFEERQDSARTGYVTQVIHQVQSGLSYDRNDFEAQIFSK